MDAEIALIRDALTARMGEITRSVVASIRQQIPFYADAGAVSEEMVTAAVHDNLSYMVRALTDTTFDTAPAAATGRTRAEIGVPLAAVMHAYRIGVHRVWQEVHAIAEARPELSRQALLSATQHMWEAQDQFVDAMAGAHRDRTTEQALDDAAERAALAEYLLQGRIPSDQSLWEIATILRIPTTGPYLAVAAATVEVGRAPLPGIADRLRAIDAYSAWRLLPDQQIGIVHAPTPAVRTAVIDLLRRVAVARVGVSAPFGDLRDTRRGSPSRDASWSGRAPASRCSTVPCSARPRSPRPRPPSTWRGACCTACTSCPTTTASRCSRPSARGSRTTATSRTPRRNCSCTPTPSGTACAASNN